MSAWKLNRFSYGSCAFTGGILSAVFTPILCTVFGTIIISYLDNWRITPSANAIGQILIYSLYFFSIPGLLSGIFFSILNKFFRGKWAFSFVITWIFTIVYCFIIYIKFHYDTPITNSNEHLNIFGSIILLLTPVACLNAYLIHWSIAFWHDDIDSEGPTP